MSIKTTAIFDFLLKNFRNLSSLLRNFTYLSLLNSFLFLSRFSFSLKSLDNYFFRWFPYKSLLSIFSVLISYNVWSSNHFSIPAVCHVFQGPDISPSKFNTAPCMRTLKTWTLTNLNPEKSVRDKPGP